MNSSDKDWTISTYDGVFRPDAFGPKNICVEVTAEFIDIEHEVPSDYYSRSTITTSVRIPRAWLMAVIAACDSYDEKKQDK